MAAPHPWCFLCPGRRCWPCPPWQRLAGAGGPGTTGLLATGNLAGWPTRRPAVGRQGAGAAARPVPLMGMWFQGREGGEGGIKREKKKGGEGGKVQGLSVQGLIHLLCKYSRGWTAGCCGGGLSHPAAATRPSQPCARWKNKVAFNQREVKTCFFKTSGWEQRARAGRGPAASAEPAASSL